MVKRVLIFFCFYCGGLAITAPSALAQRPGTAFTALDVYAAGTVNLNRNFLHTFWQPDPGGLLSISTPFYLGTVEAGGTYQRFGATAAVPRLDAIFVFLGWGWEMKRGRLGWMNTARIGNYRMMFDEQTFAGVRNENELAVGVATRVQVRLGRGFSLNASGSYMKAYTFLRLKLFHASAGVSYRFGTPRWLRRVLE